VHSNWIRDEDKNSKLFHERDSGFKVNSRMNRIRIHYLLFANSIRINYLFDEFTLNALSFSLWIPYLLCEFTVNSLCFRELTFNVLFWFPYLGEFNSNSLWIHYLFREITLYLLYFSQIQFESTISFMK